MRARLQAPPPELTSDGAAAGFSVNLDNFEGPFDLLLQLISRHKLDITEVSLSRVTDEFIAHVRAAGPAWDLDQTTSFLVVAATLLDLKTARLLPQGEIDDPEDLALLEARDLLFARLLQYRAFKIIAGWIEETLTGQGRRYPRPGGLEPEFAGLLPEVSLTITPDDLAGLAARAITPKAAAELTLTHLHQPKVSVREQAMIISERLERAGTLTFRALCGDADTLTTVARFLALLELFRQRAVAFEQLTPLGELTVRWTGEGGDEIVVTDEFEGAPLNDAAEVADQENQ